MTLPILHLQTRLHYQAQAALRFVGAMAGVATLIEDGSDVAGEVTLA